MATRHQSRWSRVNDNAAVWAVTLRDGVAFESREQVPGRGARLPKDSILSSNRCLVSVSPLQPGKASPSVPPPPQAHNGPHRLNVRKQGAGVPAKTVKSKSRVVVVPMSCSSHIVLSVK